MSYRENDDELERMRARRSSGGQRRGSAGGYRENNMGYPGRHNGYRESNGFEARRQYNHSSGDEYDEGYDEDYAFDEDYLYGEDQYDESSGGFGYEDVEPSGYDSGSRREPRQVSKRGRVSEASIGSERAGRRRNEKSESPGRNQKDKGGIAKENRGRNGKGSAQPQRQMEKKRKKHRWKSILLILLAAVIGYGAWLFLHRPTGYWNIAVFGVDSRDGGTKKALADVQMICSINRSTGEIRLVSVYRDTYLKINSEGTYHKINEAYFKGGYKQGVSALEENLDLKIDDYATFNWKSVAEAINILGGVELEITPAEFAYINAFITETVESTGIGSVQLSQPGMQLLDGVQAVAYSRLRLMDTDFQRTERQRKVVQLALEKAKKADVSTLTSLAAYLVPQISTSVSVNDVLPLVKDIGKYHIGETGGFPFSRQSKKVGKMDCVIPTTLESNVILLHQFLYGEDTGYRPSSAVKKISAHISEETGLYEEGKAAPSGGASGGGSSGKTNGGSDGKTQPPAETASPEPLPETTEPEESAEETTKETTGETEESGGKDKQEETEESGEIGPGVTDKPSKEPGKTEEETREQGPGVDSGTKPSDKPSQTPSGSSPGASESGGPGGSGAGNTEAAGGSQTQEAAENSPGPGGSGPGAADDSSLPGGGPGAS